MAFEAQILEMYYPSNIKTNNDRIQFYKPARCIKPFCHKRTGKQKPTGKETENR